MPVDVTATLQKAVRELEVEKARIDHQLGALRDVLGSLDRGKGRAVRARRQGRSRPRRRPMSSAARRALSRRMKAYWAKRRAAQTKGKAKVTAEK